MLNKPYSKYKVVKEISGVKHGKTIPWFDQPGNGLQYEFPEESGIGYLLKNGYIEKI